MAKIKVLHISTHDEDCGIGKYEEQFLECMQGSGEIENKFFPYSPNEIKHMSAGELQKVIKQLDNEMKDYDIMHIQHEFGFYPNNELVRFCQVAKKRRKKLIVTYHTSPDLIIKNAHLGGLGPRSIIHYLRARRYNKKMIYGHIAPARQADLVIAHNKLTIKALESFGIPAAKLHRLQMPIPVIKEYEETSTEITEGLHKTPGDIIFCTVGFMHRFKGLFEAVKALHFLPSNYKLAIIGGLNPESHDIKVYNDVCDLIVKWGLTDRVYVTGFVKDDDQLNRLIRECDASVYPYDGVYYSRVSSASMSTAFANRMPVVAYPTQTFIEIAEESQAILLTNGFSYYELARSLRNADLGVLKERSTQYAKDKAYPEITKDIVKLYQRLMPL